MTGRVVIVGVSAAGLAAAETLRRNGHAGTEAVAGGVRRADGGVVEDDTVTSVHRTGDRLAGVLSVCMPPKSIRPGQAIAACMPRLQATSLLDGEAA